MTRLGEPADSTACLEINNAHQPTQVSENRPPYLVQPSLSLTYPRILLPNILTPMNHGLHCPELL